LNPKTHEEKVGSARGGKKGGRGSYYWGGKIREIHKKTVGGGEKREKPS